MPKRILTSTIIIVLTVSQVLFSFPFNHPDVKEAHAATRLGLHVTQEELNIWKQRMTDNVGRINGFTYQNIYTNRILASANTFTAQSHPGGDGFWNGTPASFTGTCAHVDQSRPGRSNGQHLMRSAFVYLLTGNTTYADPVRTELLSQITQPNTDWSNANGGRARFV